MQLKLPLSKLIIACYIHIPISEHIPNMEYIIATPQKKKEGNQRKMKRDWLDELEFTSVNYVEELTYLYCETPFALVFSEGRLVMKMMVHKCQ